ncbi:ribonuclease HII [bacterium]|nr:MAG: ribonuclease HII [bacterium]
MNVPNLREEKILFKKNYKYIAGIDEAGRGPLAGPVVSAAVVFKKNNLNKWLNFNIKDSKKLSQSQRKSLLAVILQNAIEVKTSRVSEGVIDKINIRQATLLSMERSIKKLKNKPDFVLIDGRDTIKKIDIDQKAIINGDNRSIIIASASIVAKETRDDIMRRYSKKYPKYGFERHKGYGTEFHREMLKKYGPCKIHRFSFRPIKKI